MPEMDDIALLRQYAENNWESAFTTLVERHSCEPAVYVCRLRALKPRCNLMEVLVVQRTN